MNREFIYKPNRYNVVFVLFCSILTILFLFFFSVVLHLKEYQSVFWFFLMVIFFGVSTKIFYDSSKLFVIFETDGLRILNDKKRVHSYISWKKISYGYYRKTYRGHIYLVLSPESLELKNVKQIVNRCHNLSKIQFDNAIAINLFTGNKEEITYIKEIVSEKIMNVKEM